MNHLLTMTENGLAVVMVSPCCQSSMELTPGEINHDKESRAVSMNMDFCCSSCKKKYDVGMEYKPFIDVELTIQIDPEALK